jgi:hypothetical protein
MLESWPAAVLGVCAAFGCANAPRSRMEADPRVPGDGAGAYAPRGNRWARLPVTGAGGGDAPRAAPLAPLRAQGCCGGRSRGSRESLKTRKVRDRESNLID